MRSLATIFGINLSAGTTNLSDLCKLYDATTTPVTQSLSLGLNQNGVRGVFADEPIDAVGTTIFAIPLESCLRDDQSRTSSSSHDDEAWSWATRLASGFLNLRQRQERGDALTQAQQTWLGMLPDSETLRASLPVHWDDQNDGAVSMIASRCPSMATALDSSYFIRAEAVAQLQQDHFSSSNSSSVVRQCHDALDIVQTRSCRVDPGVRLLAPVFDLLNHAKSTGGRGGADSPPSANAEFLRDGESLIVRTIDKVKAGSEILIDYGDSAQPAWKCLLSYGFVPADNLLGEIVVDGTRYTVGPESIPFELVEAICAKLNLDEVDLTEPVCAYLADWADDAVVAAQQDAQGAAAIKNNLLMELFQSEERALATFAQGLREFHN